MTSLIYVHYPGREDNLFKEIVTLLNDEKYIFRDSTVIIKDDYFLKVGRNKDAASAGTKMEKYNYMDLRYYIDFSPSDDMEEDKIIAILSQILEHFWSQNIAAVAESEFEEKLPREGGAKGYDIPWPEVS